MDKQIIDLLKRTFFFETKLSKTADIGSQHRIYEVKVHTYLGGYKLLQRYFWDGTYLLRGKVTNNLIFMLLTRDYKYTEVFLGMR